MKSLLFTVLLLFTPGAVSAQTLIPFGDSTTAPRGRTAVYSSLLASDLYFSGRELQVINAGIGGQTTRQALARFEKDVLVRRPDVVVIQFGINDAAVDVWRKPPATAPRVALSDYRENLIAMVQALKNQGARVILMTPNRTYWTPKLKELYGRAPYLPDDPDGFNVLLRGYAEAVRAVAREENVGLVDVFAAFTAADGQSGRKPGWLCGDGMHPDDDGHRLVADLIIKHLGEADPRFVRKPGTVSTPSGHIHRDNPASGAAAQAR